MTDRVISSVEMLVQKVLEDYKEWDTSSLPWFRGEGRDVDDPLMPEIFRVENGREHDEMRLLQHFRMKAPSLGLPYVPARDLTDQWLFLAQHVGLPTRLLDWSEGLLIALHFALYSRHKGAVVWMLDPIELNKLTDPKASEKDFALTWFSPRRRTLRTADLPTIQKMIWTKGIYGPNIFENVGTVNIHKAWGRKAKGTEFPYAFHPTNIHPRMSSQISRFTIHGEDERGMPQMRRGPRILRKFTIGIRAISDIKDELRIMGITHSSLFPDLDGLSKELAQVY